MKNKNRYSGSVMTKIGCCLMAAAMVPIKGWACACGCGVFDVATSSMIPNGPGGMAYFDYFFQDQNRNWSGTSEAPAENNTDKQIKTDFFSIGLQYMFNDTWGVQAEVPYDFRTFKTDVGAGNIVTKKWNQLGDIRLKGIYTGFSPDLSAGLTLGVKLPTGNFNVSPDIVDRDTQLGTGSTDALLGGFYRGEIWRAKHLEWFAQGELDLPVATQQQYRPGVEFDAAAGIYFKGFSLGRVSVIPIAQVIFSERDSDSGANASNPVASGYTRVLLSPGIEFHIHPFTIYADAEVPVYQNFTGNQLAGPVLFKMTVSYMF
jgi:hypothetical protein